MNNNDFISETKAVDYVKMALIMLSGIEEKDKQSDLNFTQSELAREQGDAYREEYKLKCEILEKEYVSKNETISKKEDDLRIEREVFNKHVKDETDRLNDLIKTAKIEQEQAKLLKDSADQVVKMSTDIAQPMMMAWNQNMAKLQSHTENLSKNSSILLSGNKKDPDEDPSLWFNSIIKETADNQRLRLEQELGVSLKDTPVDEIEEAFYDYVGNKEHHKKANIAIDTLYNIHCGKISE